MGGAVVAGSPMGHGHFTAQEVPRVRKQLSIGLDAIEHMLGTIPAQKFPVVVHLRTGRGVSYNEHGQGPIELYWVREVQEPIIHKLTHVVAGYTAAHGHWTPEGLASYVQDHYGEDTAFPTRKMAHALAKVIRDEHSQLPLREVTQDRDRQRYFGVKTPWHRWLAYTQSTSLCQYVIDTYGMDTFIKLYDQPLEAIDFPQLLGKRPEELVADWEAHLSHLEVDTTRAHHVFIMLQTQLRGTGGLGSTSDRRSGRR
jgi:hypothetical protein